MTTHSSDRLKNSVLTFAEVANQFFVFSRDLLCIQDANGTLFEINPAWQHWLEFDASDVVGKSFLDFVHPKDRDKTWRAHQRVIAGEIVDGLSTRFRTRSGDYRRLSWRSTLLDNGYICAIARDNTQEFLLERQSKHRDHLLAIAAMTAHHLMSSEDVEPEVKRALDSVRRSSDDCCVFIYQNQYVDEQLQCSKLRCLSTACDVHAAYRWDHLEVIDYREPGFASWLSAFESGLPVQGKISGMHDNIQSVHSSGEIASMVLIPITVRNKFWGIIGTDSKEERELWSDADIATLMAVGNVIAGAYAREEANQQRLQALRRSEDAAGQLKQALEKSEQLREVAEKMAAQAQAADKAKSAFLANMSHEIRTPMTAILGYIDMLSHETTSSQERAEYMRTIRQSGNHLMELINNILDLASIQAEQLSVKTVCLDPRDLIRETIEQHRVTAAKGGLYLDLKMQPPIPNQLCTNDLRFRQILSILLDNAIKFTEQGGVTVTVSAEREPDEATLKISVTDTGIGIEPDAMERLFKPFSRGDESMTVSHGGTGLGLVLARHITDALSLHIEVHSEPGIGSTFTVHAPLDTDSLSRGWREKMTGDADDTIRIIKRSSQSVEQSCRILVAEDDPAIQRLLNLVFKQAGFRCDMTANGHDACAAFMSAVKRDEPYDIVFMDMQMPEMDGYEATRMLRRSGFNTPVIACTAHAMPGDRDRCLDAGCTDYVSKPVQREVLCDMIEKHLNIKSPTS